MVLIFFVQIFPNYFLFHVDFPAVISEQSTLKIRDIFVACLNIFLVFPNLNDTSQSFKMVGLPMSKNSLRIRR